MLDPASLSLKFLSLLLSLCVIGAGCAVTGPKISPQEEAAARDQLKDAYFLNWWQNQKRLLRVADRFAWSVRTPEAPYKLAFGVLPVLRRQASTDELGLFHALGNPRDGTVIHVSAGSPGDRAGLTAGDEIISIDDKNISSMTKEDIARLAAFPQPRKFSIRKSVTNEQTIVTIAPAEVLDITFYAYRSELINAMAGPLSGVNFVIFTYGMLNVLQTDDEIAAVMGHELIHILKDHYGRRSTIQGVGALVSVAVILAGAATGVNVTSAVRGVQDLTKITGRAFSREYERESDYLGLYLAHQAGFDINATIRYWEQIASVKPQLGANYMSTHPSTPERFVRILKTIEEIQSGGTLQAAWYGEVSATQLASAPAPKSTQTVVSTPSTASVPPASASPRQSTTATPRFSSETPVLASLPPSPSATPSPAPPTVTKTYASLIQYDGPKVKSGVTLDAQFIEDGSGSGQTIVSDIRNVTLRGTFTTIMPGANNWPKPKILDRQTLNRLQILSDKPWVIASLTNSDTVLECVYGETRPLGQKKGACRDNWGNRYWLYINP